MATFFEDTVTRPLSRDICSYQGREVNALGNIHHWRDARNARTILHGAQYLIEARNKVGVGPEWRKPFDVG